MCLSLFFRGILVFLAGFWAIGCVPKGKVTASVSKAKSGQVSAMTTACIKGRVVDENGKGIAYVFVQTKPSTSPAITDRAGHYEFCHAKKNVDGSVESTKYPIPPREYTILVNKDGYVAKPQKIEFQGKTVSLAAIPLLEKQLAPGVEIQTKGRDKVDQTKRTDGITGSHPKGG